MPMGIDHLIFIFSLLYLCLCYGAKDTQIFELPFPSFEVGKSKVGSRGNLTVNEMMRATMTGAVRTMNGVWWDDVSAIIKRLEGAESNKRSNYGFEVQSTFSPISPANV